MSTRSDRQFNVRLSEVSTAMLDDIRRATGLNQRQTIEYGILKLHQAALEALQLDTVPDAKTILNDWTLYRSGHDLGHRVHTELYKEGLEEYR